MGRHTAPSDVTRRTGPVGQGPPDTGKRGYGQAKVAWRVSVVDYIAFGIPAIFLVVLWTSRAHFRRHPVAGTGLVLLTLVGILHFDVGMLTTDPYDGFLDDISAPARTWTVSVVFLILLSYSGEIQDRFLSTQPRERRPRRRSSQSGVAGAVTQAKPE